MFGRKSKNELLAEIARLKIERSDLLKRIEFLNNKFDEYARNMDAMPEGCQRGPWYKGCVFNAFMNVPYPYDQRTYTTIYYCKRGTVCKHFTGKGEEKND